MTHQLQLVIVPHIVDPSTSSILTQMFTVGGSGKLAHSPHSPLAALQLLVCCRVLLISGLVCVDELIGAC